MLPEGTVPRIIDDETAFKVLAAAGINTQESTRNNPNVEDTLLRSGYIRCGLCGNLMSMRRHNKPQQGKAYLSTVAAAHPAPFAPASIWKFQRLR